MDFEEHDEQEEDMDMGVLPGYPRQHDTTRQRLTSATAEGASTTTGRRPVRYRECLKNHAVNMGGHAVDGCGEFMAAGDEGTLDALKCAACNCHRNFHRKETDVIGEGAYHHHHHLPQFPPYYRAPPPTGYLHLTSPAQIRPLALPAASGGGGYSREIEEDVSNPSSSGGVSKRRFRTKFTQDQKDKLLAFSESLGWRIQKHDEDAVQQFCSETGIERQVFKVWMHNNKHTVGKKP